MPGSAGTLGLAPSRVEKPSQSGNARRGGPRSCGTRGARARACSHGLAHALTGSPILGDACPEERLKPLAGLL
ncbi:hypothetical protein P7K49_027826, partial [Saguinus oedipus]